MRYKKLTNFSINRIFSFHILSHNKNEIVGQIFKLHIIY